MEEKSKFRVMDKRAFTESGERREESEGEPVQVDQGTPSAGGEIPVDFSQLVLMFYHQSIAALGLIRHGDEGGEKAPPTADLDAARYFIDLLGLLDEKTRNNLTAIEEKLLSDVLYELRMAYVHVVKGGGEQAR